MKDRSKLTINPAVSEAQRKLLYAKFGSDWVHEHHFDNAGKLPPRVAKSKRKLKRTDNRVRGVSPLKHDPTRTAALRRLMSQHLKRRFDAMKAQVVKWAQTHIAIELPAIPTLAQAKAGNYRKGHVKVQGLDVSIETAKGTKRKPYHEKPVAVHYGYIRRTEGADGDHVDVFLGPNLDSTRVWVIDQHVDGAFDEHKCLIGFDSQEEAVKAYKDSYSDDWNGIGRVREMSMDEFKAWLAEGPTRNAETCVILDWVLDVRQKDHYSCGAAAWAAVAGGYGVHRTLSEWKRELGTDVEESTRPQAIVETAQRHGFHVEARDELTIEDIAEYIRRGWPVICPVQDYGPEVPKGARFEYGHYVTVIGRVPGYLVCQDSSEDNVIAGEGSVQAPGRVLIADDVWDAIHHDEDVDGNKYVRFGIAIGPPSVANAQERDARNRFTSNDLSDEEKTIAKAKLTALPANKDTEYAKAYDKDSVHVNHLGMVEDDWNDTHKHPIVYDIDADKKFGKVMSFPLAGAGASQDGVSTAGLAAYIERQPDPKRDGWPEVARDADGKYHVLSGHTRLGAVALAGRTHGVAVVFQYDTDGRLVKSKPKKGVENEYNPDQPRDAHGRFGSGGVERAKSLLKATKVRLDAMLESPRARHVKAAFEFSKKTVKTLKDKLEGRYGKAAAIAIMASGQATGWGITGVGAAFGVPLWIPFSSIWGVLPGVAVAEAVLQGRKLLAKGVHNVDTAAAAKEFLAELQEEYRKWLEEHRELVTNLDTDAAIVVAVRSATQKGRTGPDHQRLFWDPEAAEAWWMSADGDERHDVRAILDAIRDVPGVAKVTEGDERSPKDDRFKELQWRKPVSNASPWITTDRLEMREDGAVRSKLLVNFDFNEDPARVESFKAWLRKQLDVSFLSDEELWQRYIERGYRQGAGRSFDDARASLRATATTQRQVDYLEGSREEFLRSSFAQPVAQEKVVHLAGRAFTDLRNVTEDMSTRLQRALSDGLVRGDSPHDVAKDLAAAVDFTRARAETIARTELIRAHSEGQLDSLTALGAASVGVAVEWSATEGACELCSDMDGVVYSIADARGLIPRHPNCRCAFVPSLEKPTANRFCPTGVGGGKNNSCGAGAKASAAEARAARTLATRKIVDAPVPTQAQVEKARAEMERVRREGATNPNLHRGGTNIGGSAEDRRRQRRNLFREFGGEEKGYVVCPWTGIKMHWTDDPNENPHGYPKFERGKIFVKCQGGGYQLPNLIPESFTANRARNDKRLRQENSDGC